MLQANLLLFTLLYPSFPSGTTNPKYLKCWKWNVSWPVLFVLSVNLYNDLTNVSDQVVHFKVHIQGLKFTTKSFCELRITCY